MDNYIPIIDFPKQKFLELDWRETPCGYEVSGQGVTYPVYPNEQISQGSATLLVDHSGKGLSAIYLGQQIRESKHGSPSDEAILMFAATNPRDVVFSCRRSELNAVHSLADETTSYFADVSAFTQAGFTNDVTSVPINPDWRPWHSNSH